MFQFYNDNITTVTTKNNKMADLRYAVHRLANDVMSRVNACDLWCKQ